MKRLLSTILAGAAALLIAAAPQAKAEPSQTLVLGITGPAAGKAIAIGAVVMVGGCEIAYKMTGRQHICGEPQTFKQAFGIEDPKHFAYAGRNDPVDYTVKTYAPSAFDKWMASVNGVALDTQVAAAR